MAVIEISNTKQAGALINYCKNKTQSIGERDGYNVDPERAQAQMLAIRQMYHKNDGVQAHCLKGNEKMDADVLWLMEYFLNRVTEEVLSDPVKLSNLLGVKQEKLVAARKKILETTDLETLEEYEALRYECDEKIYKEFLMQGLAARRAMEKILRKAEDAPTEDVTSVP